MKNKITEANVSMVISKTFSGLNMNALKYLLPLWMTPLSGVTIRCTFAAVAFWIIGMFTKPENLYAERKDIPFPVRGVRYLWLYVLLPDRTE